MLGHVLDLIGRRTAARGPTQVGCSRRLAHARIDHLTALVRWTFGRGSRGMAVSVKGHTIWTETRDRRDEFPQMGQSAVKRWAVCSCGYRSKPYATEDAATAAALSHLWKAVAPNLSRAAFMQQLPQLQRRASA